MKSKLYFLTLLFTVITNCLWAQNLDIGIFNNPANSNILEIRVRPTANINSLSYSAGVFTVRTPTVNNVSFTISSPFGYSDANITSTSGAYTYHAFQFASGSPTNVTWLAGQEIVIATLIFSSSSATNSFELVTNDVWTNANNANFYQELGGNSVANTIYQNSTGNFTLSPSLACFEKVKVTLNSDCSYTLTGAELGTPTRTNLMIRKITTPGAQDYVPGYNNGVYTGSSIIFGKNDIGSEFEIMSGTGTNMCFHYVSVLDGGAPVALAAIPDTYIKCTDLVNGIIPPPSVLGSWKGATGLGQVLNPINSSVKWTASDCSNFTQSWTDEYGASIPCAADNCSYQTVIRHWTLKDIYGNVSATYNQTIYIVSPIITIPGIATGATSGTINYYDCTLSANAVGLPFINWANCGVNAANENVILAKDYCGHSIDLLSENRMNLCAGSYMLTRVYKINNCGVFTTVTQTINVFDRTTPSVNLAFNDYLRVKEPMCYNMNGMPITEFVYKTVVTPISVNAGNEPTVIPAPDNNPNPIGSSTSVSSFKITPLVSSISCNAASISIAYTVLDPKCSNGNITIYSDNPVIRFNGSNTMVVASGTTVTVTGTFNNIPGDPDPVVHIYAKDACGNITEVKLTIVIYDNVSPTSICNNKTQVSLTNNGQAVVFPYTFSSQSYDNCIVNGVPIPPATGNIRQLIRLTGTDCWFDWLVFDCSTVNGKVDIRTIDGCGNYSDCCVEYEIVNKPSPTCTPYQDVTTVCTDSRLSNLNSLFTEPASYSNCGNITVTSTTPVLNLNCGAGTAIKTWTFTANGQSVSCSQSLTVTRVPGFRVLPLDDINLTCGSYTYTAESEKNAALARVKLLNNNGETTCAAPVVEIDTVVFKSSDYCKIIRIRYTIIDYCQPFCTIPADAIWYKHFDGQPNSSTGTAYGAAKSDGYFQAATYTCAGGTAYVFGYERFIRINDVIAPESTPPTIAPISFPSGRCTFDFPAINLTGVDRCDATTLTNSNLFIAWYVIDPQGNTIATGNGTTTSGSGVTIANSALNGLVGGTYTVRYTIEDFCGNVNAYAFNVVARDGQTPMVLVHNKILALSSTGTPSIGSGEVCIDDVLNNLSDNCSGYAYLYSRARLQRVSDAAVYSTLLPTCLTFTCSDKDQNVLIRVWTIDEAGNSNFAIDTITVQANGACSTPLSIVTGNLKTENNQPVNSVTVNANINNTIVGTGFSTDGAFKLTTLSGQDVQVRADKLTTEDRYTGITTFDIARINRHILELDYLTSPYSIIAADVNKDGFVDGSDVLHIRNLILRKSTGLPGGIWRFMDKSYVFKNPANPFGEDFPEVVNFKNIPTSAVANFTAIKLGDVNTSYVVPSTVTNIAVRNSKTLLLQAEDMELQAGNEYTVNITSDNFNAETFQGTFSFNGATVKTVKAGDLVNYSDGNFGVFAHEITTSWNGKSKQNAHVMTITFVAQKSAKLSEVLTIGSSLTSSVANDAQGTEMNVNLKFTTGKISGSEFALYQNVPNPMAHETRISFNLPDETTAKLIIYNVEGKILMIKNGAYKAGYNEISINKSELNAHGVMYYRLETPEHTATKKMIVID